MPARTRRPRASSAARAASSARRHLHLHRWRGDRDLHVTITSAVAGTTVVSATSDIPVNGVDDQRTTSTAANTAAGGSGNASKTWHGGGLITDTNVSCSDVLSGAAERRS